MKDYYNEFVKLSLQQCNKNDYANKLKVINHNVASKKLIQISDDSTICFSAKMLLQHNADKSFICCNN